MRTVVSGGGGTTASVFTIRGPGVVRLENLHIVGGDTPGSGGGIWYEGSSIAGSVNTLFLTRTMIDGNYAGSNGGGVRFGAGNNQFADLVLENDTGFFRNRADGNGGGLYMNSRTRLFAEGHRLFFYDNEAGGSGGAINFHDPWSVDFGSGSWLGLATFLRNKAGADGGAIHVFASVDAQPSMLRFYSIVPDQPLAFANNEAGIYGGAISVFAEGVPSGIAPPVSVCTSNINLRANYAKAGAAVRITRGRYGFCGGVDFPPAAVVQCTPKTACNRIEQNSTIASTPEAQGAATLRLYGASADLRDHTITRNNGQGHLLTSQPSDSIGSSTNFTNSLITGNFYSVTEPHRLFDIGMQSNVNFLHCTLAANGGPTGAALSVFRLPSSGAAQVQVQDSIVHQPNMKLTTTTTMPGPALLTLNRVLLPVIPSDRQDNPTLLAADPQFVSNDDFHLQATSPALDYSPDESGFRSDLDGNPRPIDLSSHPNLFGPIDLGVYELPPAQAGELFHDGFED